MGVGECLYLLGIKSQAGRIFQGIEIDAAKTIKLAHLVPRFSLECVGAPAHQAGINAPTASSGQDIAERFGDVVRIDQILAFIDDDQFSARKFTADLEGHGTKPIEAFPFGIVLARLSIIANDPSSIVDSLRNFFPGKNEACAGDTLGIFTALPIIDQDQLGGMGAKSPGWSASIFPFC